MHIAIPIIIFLLILGLVVFTHELGHFLAARRAGVFVEEFALGMGPKIFSFYGKPNNEVPVGPQIRQEKPTNFLEGGSSPEGENRTMYSLRMLPVGGFCRMRGQDEDMPQDPTALNNKSIPKRMLVMAGGSLMNFLLAFVLFFVLALLSGYQVAEVRGLQEGRPAHEAGLQVGDRITHINGNRVTLYENFLLQLEFSGGEPMDVRVNRNGEILRFSITPVELAPNTFRLGFFPDIRFGLLETPAEGYGRVSVGGTVVNAAEMMLFNIRVPFTMLARFVTGRNMPAGAGVMGPIGMAGEVTAIYQDVIEQGIGDTVIIMLYFAALLSVAVGLFNILPIPVMDGARIVFLLIEAIRRKPVPPERESMVHMVGVVLIIGLAIFIAFRDIMRLLPG